MYLNTDHTAEPSVTPMDPEKVRFSWIIRAAVVGRLHWLTVTTTVGADTTAIITRTCRSNVLSPQQLKSVGVLYEFRKWIVYEWRRKGGIRGSADFPMLEMVSSYISDPAIIPFKSTFYLKQTTMQDFDQKCYKNFQMCYVRMPALFPVLTHAF